jgi:hypothetical protein
MYHKIGLAFLMTILSLLASCRGAIKLIDKHQTPDGTVRFYIESIERNKSDVKGIYASVNNRGTRIYYRFCPEEIVMTTEKAKQLTYIVYHEKLLTNYDSNIYKKYSPLDSIVLTRGDKLLDSLGLENFKKAFNSEAYQIQVNYYHGYPKWKKIRLENCR